MALAVALGCQAGPTPSPQLEPQREAQSASELEAESPDESAADSIWREQKLIRNADLNIEVSDVDAAAHAVETIVSRHDGLVADSQTSQYSSGRRFSSISLRIPASQFDATLAELRVLGRVEHEGVTTQDVTKAYFDLETRLAVKRDAAKRLREILTRRTGNLADVITAERELSRITEEIEQLEGEKRFYDHKIATSTIRVNLSEREGAVLSIIEPVTEALRDSARVLAGSLQAMIYVVTASAPWALVGGLCWILVRRARRRREPS